MVLQNKASTYDTDLFSPIFNSIFNVRNYNIKQKLILQILYLKLS